MSDTPLRTLQRLAAALPLGGGAHELLLRPDGSTPTATLRVDGAPPRVWELRGETLAELLPGADTGLPGHALLGDPMALGEALAPHTGPVAGSRLVAWRPGRRAVVRAVAADGAVHWVKLLDAKGFRRAKAAFAALGQALAPLRLVVPHTLLPEVAAFVLPNAPGPSLRELLAADRPLPTALLGRGLLALGYTPVGPDLPRIDFAAARAATVAMLAKAAASRPELAELAGRIEALVAPDTTPQSSLVHGDLHDKQVFLGGGELHLIDLEGLGVGDPRFDLANLVEHVRLRDLQQHGHDRGFADVLANRCGLDVTSPAARAFRTVVRARLCGVYALRPRWRTLVDRLLDEARTLAEAS